MKAAEVLYYIFDARIFEIDKNKAIVTHIYYDDGFFFNVKFLKNGQCTNNLTPRKFKKATHETDWEAETYKKEFLRELNPELLQRIDTLVRNFARKIEH